MALTPHGPGFSFLDAFEIVEPGKRARGRKYLDAHLPFFADHFPGRPLLPGVLLVECAAQTAGAFWQRTAHLPPEAPAFLAAVHQFRFRQPVLPGQTLETEVTLEKDLGLLAQFDVLVRVGETVVAQGKLSLSRQLAPG